MADHPEPDEPFGHPQPDQAEAAGPSDAPAGDDEAGGGWETVEGEDPGHTALPPKVEAWRRRSATGAILTGFALGLQQALDNKREEPGIVAQTTGEPPEDLPVEADFEYGRPRNSVVSIRPWLIRDEVAPDDAGPGAGRPGEGDPGRN